MTVIKSYYEYDENGEAKFVARLELDDRFQDDIHYCVITNVAALRFDTLEEAEDIFKDIFLIQAYKNKFS